MDCEKSAVAAKSTSAIKAFTWRAIATTITTILVLVVTGELHLAAKVGVADIITKLIAYYLHERAWLKLAMVEDVHGGVTGTIYYYLNKLRGK